MAVKISGLISGLDTDSIVKELVSAYSTKKDSYTKKQTKLDWTMDAWSTVNSKTYSFYSSTLSNMRYSSNYSAKKAVSSKESVATVTASSDAVIGNQTLSVSQLATSGYMTGGKVLTAAGTAATKDTKMSELGLTGSGSINVNGNQVNYNEDTTINGLVNALKTAGVNANFDATSGRMFVSSKSSGADNEFTVTAGDANGIDAIIKLGLFSAKDINGNETAEMSYYKKLAADDFDYDAAVQKEYDASKYTEESYKKYLENLVKTATDKRDEAKTKLDKYNADDYDYTKDFKSEEEFNEAKQKLSEEIDGYEKTIADNNDLLNDSAKFAEAFDKTNSDIESRIKDKITAQIDAAKKVVAGVAAGTYTDAADSARITAQDSMMKLNGASFTSSTNSYSINGLNITLTGTTTAADGTDSPVMLSTTSDTQGIYDKIKSFLKEYNELIKYIDGQYNAEAATGYEPLTDDEKESLTDKQIEKWEEKIKNSLLRKDSTLGNISSGMKNAIMSTSITVKGVDYNLSSFGISTGSYFSTAVADRGMLHIDGDSDDSVTATNKDKLMAAISNDPDAVVEFFQTLSQNVYSELSSKMRSTSLSSAFTIYNDKEMSSQYSDYKDKVSQWEDKLKTYEDYYYKKFSKMESALSKLQSQTSSLSNLFGG